MWRQVYLVRWYECVSPRVCVCSVYTYAYVHVCVCVSMFFCTYVCMYVCMHACIYIYIYIYIHTYICKQRNKHACIPTQSDVMYLSIHVSTCKKLHKSVAFSGIDISFFRLAPASRHVCPSCVPNTGCVPNNLGSDDGIDAPRMYTTRSRPHVCSFTSSGGRVCLSQREALIKDASFGPG